MIDTLRANMAASLFGLLAAVFCVATIIQTVRLDGFLWVDGANDRNEILTRDNNELRFAAKEAKRLNDEQVARIETEQQKVTDDVEADLTARLERLRSELRSKAPQGAAGRPQASPDGPPTGATADPAKVCISPEQFLLGAEYEEKLDQWVSWWERVSKIER